jgi:hypothetical protein
MARHSRTVDHTYNPVATYTVAEHRYRWDREDLPPLTWRECRDNAPYKVGDVVYVVYGDGFRKAIIHRVDVGRDRWDDWREQYFVLPETTKGEWGKLGYVAHPGYIQRGYQRAGLAPEMPE